MHLHPFTGSGTVSTRRSSMTTMHRDCVWRPRDGKLDYLGKYVCIPRVWLNTYSAALKTWRGGWTWISKKLGKWQSLGQYFLLLKFSCGRMELLHFRTMTAVLIIAEHEMSEGYGVSVLPIGWNDKIPGPLNRAEKRLCGVSSSYPALNRCWREPQFHSRSRRRVHKTQMKIFDRNGWKSCRLPTWQNNRRSKAQAMYSSREGCQRGVISGWKVSHMIQRFFEYLTAAWGYNELAFCAHRILVTL